MTKKYNLIVELTYNNRFYYMDSNFNFYKIKENIKLPKSPIIDMKLYSTNNFVEQIEDGNDIINDLENIICQDYKNIKLALDEFNTNHYSKNKLKVDNLVKKYVDYRKEQTKNKERL